MTRADLNCIHEPFGDAFYFGPERLAERYADDEEARIKSGFSDVTFKTVVDQLDKEIAKKDKRVFIKDIIHYLFPPNNLPASIAPSLQSEDTSVQTSGTTQTNGSSPPPNPTVIPLSILRKYHFTFLIRHPRRAIPSYYRCTIPPLSSKTGFHNFLPSEAGYSELRRTFDYLRSTHLIGPRLASSSDSGPEQGEVRITVLDADDLLDHPREVIQAYCREVGLEFEEGMLKWGGDEEAERRVREAFEKWNGFHDDAIGSTELKARENRAKTPTMEEEDDMWKEKYGDKAAKEIRECVDANVADYEYLRGFSMKF